MEVYIYRSIRKKLRLRCELRPKAVYLRISKCVYVYHMYIHWRCIHMSHTYIHTLILSTNSCCSSNKYGDTSTPASAVDAVVAVPEDPTPTPTPVLTGGVV